MIEITGVVKYFRNFKVLDGVSCSIGKGEIVGFLGRNGAGKTTLMRIITGYIPATSGQVSVCGYDVNRDPLFVKKSIGYLPEIPPLYVNMSVRDFLSFVAQMKDVAKHKLKGQVDRVLEECRLLDVSEKSIGILSKGYRQRVGIAQAIINDPQVLILDEPTAGLDPLQVVQVRELIKGLEGSRTVILSTHILSEIEMISKRVIIIDQGRILKDALLSDLVTVSDSGNSFIIYLKAEVDKVNNLLQSLNVLQSYNIQKDKDIDGFCLDVCFCPEVNDCNVLISRLLGIGAQIFEVKRKRKGLEQVFLSLMS